MASSAVSEALKAMAPTISVGILTADLLNLGSEVKLLEETGVGLIHFDVMDGCFCPSMTVGPPFIKAIKTSLLKDIHLMVVDPLEKVKDYVAAGADIITVHLESGPHIHRVFQAMGNMVNANDPERGIVRGVGLNPGTPVDSIKPLLDEIEMVSLLAINPGWGGQKFSKSTRDRIPEVREMVSQAGRDILITVDGGITRDNIVEVAQMGGDIIITGSAVFDGKAPRENAKFMFEAVRG